MKISKDRLMVLANRLYNIIGGNCLCWDEGEYKEPEVLEKVCNEIMTIFEANFMSKEKLKEFGQKLINWTEENNDEECHILLCELDDKLDELLSEDFFGTEGQSDPRVDHRDRKW